MKKLPGIFLCIILDCALLSAQDSPARIENIQTEITGKTMVVRYDITHSSPGNRHQVDFVVLDNRKNALCPDSITGDVGPAVAAGMDKEVTWEIYKEFDVVYGDFHPRLVIDVNNNKRHSRGPEFAALSLLLPGLGDYFVADVNELRIKPYYKTLTTAGILGFSWVTYSKREEIPPVMAPPGWYASADAPPGEKYVYIDHYWEKEPASTHYWLFPHDAEIILGIGIATWIFDVIWVARKGAVNNRVRNSVLEHLSFAPGSGGFQLAYRLNF
jgi:hypothetical protein